MNIPLNIPIYPNITSSLKLSLQLSPSPAGPSNYKTLLAPLPFDNLSCCLLFTHQLIAANFRLSYTSSFVNNTAVMVKIAIVYVRLASYPLPLSPRSFTVMHN